MANKYAGFFVPLLFVNMWNVITLLSFMTIEVMKCFLSVSSFSLLWNDKDDLIFLLIILIRFCITMIDERLQILLH